MLFCHAKNFLHLKSLIRYPPFPLPFGKEHLCTDILTK